MPAPTNLSFEIADASPGIPLGWTVTATSTVEEWADYGTVTPKPYDGFGSGWGNDGYLFAFLPANLSDAQFGTVHVGTIKVVEDFEELWGGNESYLLELPGQVETAAYTTTVSGGNPYDGFGILWFAGTYQTAFASDGSDVSSGGAEAFDSWAPGYLLAFVGAGTDLASSTFDGANPRETFESVRNRVMVAPYLVGGGPYTSLLVSNGGTHRFIVGDVVTFTGDALPSPLSAGTIYFVVTVPDTTRFSVSSIPGNAPFAFAGGSASPIFAAGNPATAWVDAMTTI